MFTDLEGNIDRLSVLLAALTFIAAIGAVVLGYWIWFDDRVPATIGEITILTPEIETGHLFRYSVDACKYTNHSALIQRTFIDGLILATPVVEGGHVAQGCATANLGMVIPDGLPSGSYMLEVVLKYKVNPAVIREVVYIVGPFIVIEGES